jgi:anti-sigma B factor antagonist
VAEDEVTPAPSEPDSEPATDASNDSDVSAISLSIERGSRLGRAAPGTNAVVDEEAGAVVKVAGELEFGTAPTLREALLDLSQQGADPVVVDLADVQFIDSSGVSLLVQAKQRIESQGGRFLLRRPAHRVKRVLEVSGLAEMFAID